MARSPHAPRFTTLYKKYRALIQYRILQQVPPRDADDVAQQCYLGIHRALATYDPTRPAAPLLFTIVARAIRNYRQRGSSWRELLSNELDPASSANSEARLVARERLRHGLASLSEQQRRVLLAMEVEGKSVQEIAEAEGLSKESIYRLHRSACTGIVEALRRLDAQERHLLSKRRALLLPFGLDFHPQVWITRALRRALAWAKAAASGVATSAGVVIALGATVLPPRAPRVSTQEAWMPVFAAAPISSPPSTQTSSSARPPPPPREESAASPSRPAAAERASLEHIRSILKTDPTAALAALARHRKMFPHEQFSADRENIESIARARPLSPPSSLAEDRTARDPPPAPPP